MLLFGYLLVVHLSLWFLSLQRKEIVFKKKTKSTMFKVKVTNVMLTLTFMSYQLAKRVVLRTN